MHDYYMYTVYVTEHEKTGLMYTKYISLYYGTYLQDIKVL